MPKPKYGWLTVPEVAAVVRRPAQFIYDEITRKRIAVHRIGGRIFISERDLDHYIERSRQPALGERVEVAK
jgi:excisionase family DNA binding protein